MTGRLLQFLIKMTIRARISSNVVVTAVFLILGKVIDGMRHLQECGEKNVISDRHQGILTSPNYPNPYLDGTNCSWDIKLPDNSKKENINILITNLDIERGPNDCETCCKNNALVLLNKTFCGTYKYPFIIQSDTSKAKTVRISFRVTTKNVHRRKGFRLIFSIRNKTDCEGYDLSCLDKRGCYNLRDICERSFPYKCYDHSDQINCGKCQIDRAPCNKFTDACFDPVNERCNGALDCPGGEDELDCFKECPGKIMCKTGTSCFTQKQICDHKHDCEDNSDEFNCTHHEFCWVNANNEHFICNNNKCISSKLVGNGVDDCGDNSDERTRINDYSHFAIFSLVTLSLGFSILIFRWCSGHRRLMMDFPEFPLPQFPPSENPTEHAMTIQFSDSDYLHGGEIYEAFAKKRDQTEPSGSILVQPIHEQNGECVREYDPSCEITALASLGLTVDCGDDDRSRFKCAYCYHRNLKASRRN